MIFSLLFSFYDSGRNVGGVREGTDIDEFGVMEFTMSRSVAGGGE